MLLSIETVATVISDSFAVVESNCRDTKIIQWNRLERLTNGHVGTRHFIGRFSFLTLCKHVQ